LEKNEKKVVGIEFLSSYRNDTTYWGEQARGRKSQGANRLGGETAKGRISHNSDRVRVRVRVRVRLLVVFLDLSSIHP